jgi:hypothetical protein
VIHCRAIFGRRRRLYAANSPRRLRLPAGSSVAKLHQFHRQLEGTVPTLFAAAHESEDGPTLPTLAMQQLGGYLRQTGRDADVGVKAAIDRKNCGDFMIS